MKKIFSYCLLAFFFSAAVLYPAIVFCNDSLSLTLPLSFDFSSPAVALKSSNLIISTLIALVVGYLSPYIPFINRIDKTAWRVAAIIIPALVVVAIFGFKGDAFTVFITTIWGLFSANSTHMYAIKPVGKSLNLPFFVENESQEEKEAVKKMKNKAVRSKMDL